MRTAALLLIAALLAPASAAAQAGRFLLAVGDVFIQRGASQIRAGTGTPVQPGDTIRLGTSSNAQIRLTDESIISLRQNTTFRIDEYSYSGKVDGSEKSIFSLVRGGFRTVTGAIGRLHNREKYTVRTATSTIGIRGTHYVVVHCDNDCGPETRISLAMNGIPNSDGGFELLAQTGGQGGSVNGTFGGVSDGAINVENKGGNKDFGANQYFYVANANTTPEALTAPPGFLYDRLSGQDRRKGQKGNETVPTGSGAESESRSEPPPPQVTPVSQVTTTTPPGPLAGPTPTIGIVGALSQPPFAVPTSETSAGGAFATPSQLQLSGTGASQILTGFTLISPGDTTPVTFASGVGTPSDVGGFTTPVDVHWGRWNTGTFTDSSGTTTISNSNNFHYMYGELTPPEVVAAKVGTFNLVPVGGASPAGTSVTDSNGGAGGTLNVTGFQVDFSSRNVSASGVTLGGVSGTFTSTGGFSTPLQIKPGQGAFVEIKNIAATCGGTSCGVGTASKIGMTGIFLGKAGDHLGTSWNAVTTAGPAYQVQAVRLFTCSPACP
jgi:hypothetical protein